MIGNKVKILVDGRWFESFYSGVSTYIKGLYLFLAQNETFEITIITSHEAKIRAEFPESIKIIEHQSRSKTLWLFRDIPRIIKKGNFNFAHFQYICPFSKDCVYIVTLHDLLFLDYKRDYPVSFILKNRFLFYLSAKRADILLTVSEFSKRRIAALFGIPLSKIHVTLNGVLPTYMNMINDNHNRKIEKRKYILYVSRIEPRKNHIMLIRAFVDLCIYKDYDLIFIGKETIPVKSIHNYMSLLPENIRSTIKFIENVKESELACYYKNASLFVYPSKSEGFGIPPIEAMASSTKVLCSNATALNDLSFLGKYHFDPNNENEFREKLAKILLDKDYPYDLLKSEAIKRYSWNQIAQDFALLLIKYKQIQ